ncbi:hypothetical protein E8E15_003069 [Penicillium rubens]|uniref:Pc13g15600 protein n=3 Tax=Penicillium chrysogenum species complex TaxID=254878 RepID=B6H2V7_PENRW|nr:hypothetical protein E8E15_003069 [Penicillium rubens]KZN84356.1 hypothetical protein EN45_114800 [Penicillium chrysogenum]CAP92629.1 Pc13g15600 [Penicillium rubens Wisconsin 54-1255]
MLISSASNSSYSSSVSSEHLSPYQHPPTSTLSLNTRRTPMTVKYPRFYSSPVDQETDSTPLQLYGLEQREPSIYGKPPKLLRRVSHVLGDIREDLSMDARQTTEKLKRRSTMLYDGPSTAPPSRSEAPMTSHGPPRSRPMSIISFDNWSSPTRGMSQRLSRRLSVFSSRSKPTSSKGASISSPNLIGSSTQYGNRSQASFI